MNEVMKSKIAAILIDVFGCGPEVTSAMARISKELEGKIPKRQYYHCQGDCKAFSSSSPSCICWHDEGTGPEPGPDYPEFLEWRYKSEK